MRTEIIAPGRKMCNICHGVELVTELNWEQSAIFFPNLEMSHIYLTESLNIFHQKVPWNMISTVMPAKVHFRTETDFWKTLVHKSRENSTFTKVLSHIVSVLECTLAGITVQARLWACGRGDVSTPNVHTKFWQSP